MTTRRYAVVGIIGAGVLEDPIVYGPYATQEKAEAAARRLNDAVADADWPAMPAFEVAPMGGQRAVGRGVKHLTGNLDPSADGMLLGEPGGDA